MIQNNSSFKPGGNPFMPPPQAQVLLQHNPLNPFMTQALKSEVLPSSTPKASAFSINSKSSIPASMFAPNPSSIITPDLSNNTPTVFKSPAFGTFADNSLTTVMAVNAPPKIRTQVHDDQNRGDKHGFIQDEMSLHDAFTLNSLRFKE